jgi:hypothetical protein
MSGRNVRIVWTSFVGVDARSDDGGSLITIEPKDDLKPGFYAISGQISQIGG